MEDLYFTLIISSDRQERVHFERVIRPLQTGDAEKVLANFNNLMLEADYTDSAQISSEYICRFCIYISLRSIGLMPRPEGHNAFGRADLEVEAGDKRWVFEFKFAHRATEVPVKFEEARRQIEARRYGEARLEGRTLIRVALIYCAETKRLEGMTV